jgi:hypothetical protein
MQRYRSVNLPNVQQSCLNQHRRRYDQRLPTGQMEPTVCFAKIIMLSNFFMRYRGTGTSAPEHCLQQQHLCIDTATLGFKCQGPHGYFLRQRNWELGGVVSIPLLGFWQTVAVRTNVASKFPENFVPGPRQSMKKVDNKIGNPFLIIFVKQRWAYLR